ncbi:MAG TPA: hypothetical protein VGC28_06165 [Sphingomonas sp.]
MTHPIARVEQQPDQGKLRLLTGLCGLLAILAVQILGSMEFPKSIHARWSAPNRHQAATYATIFDATRTPMIMTERR